MMADLPAARLANRRALEISAGIGADLTAEFALYLIEAPAVANFLSHLHPERRGIR
jgi:hypothetical protein